MLLLHELEVALAVLSVGAIGFGGGKEELAVRKETEIEGAEGMVEGAAEEAAEGTAEAAAKGAANVAVEATAASNGAGVAIVASGKDEPMDGERGWAKAKSRRAAAEGESERRPRPITLHQGRCISGFAS